MSVTAVQQEISMMDNELDYILAEARPVALLYFLRRVEGLYFTWMTYYSSLQDTIRCCATFKRFSSFEPGSAVDEQFHDHYQKSLSLFQEAEFVVSILLHFRKELLYQM